MVLFQIQDFQNLQRDLTSYKSWIKALELPSTSKSLFFRSHTNKKMSLEKARISLQKFIDKIMEDDVLNKSEALYGFLSPSPEYLKNISRFPIQKTKFATLSNLLKSSTSSDSCPRNPEDSDSDDHFWLDDFDSSLRNLKNDDAMAEPFYALIGEVFDMRGVFKWLRKSLMTFFQISYGSTITRQIRETGEHARFNYQIGF